MDLRSKQTATQSEIGQGRKAVRGSGAVHYLADEASLGCRVCGAPDSAVQQVDLEPGVAVSVARVVAEPTSEQPHVSLGPLLGSEDVSDPGPHAVTEEERGPVIADGDGCGPACAPEGFFRLPQGLAWWDAQGQVDDWLGYETGDGGGADVLDLPRRAQGMEEASGNAAVPAWPARVIGDQPLGGVVPGDLHKQTVPQDGDTLEVSPKRRGQPQGSAQRLRKGAAFPRCRPRCLGVPAVEVVAVVAREDVDVQVPDVLVAGRLIVLPDRGPGAVERTAHRACHALGEVPDRVTVLGGDLVEVLDVGPWDDQGCAAVARPPLRGDTGIGSLGDRDDVLGLVAFVELALLEAAERAGVCRRLMARKRHENDRGTGSRQSRSAQSVARGGAGRLPKVRVGGPEVVRHVGHQFEGPSREVAAVGLARPVGGAAR